MGRVAVTIVALLVVGCGTGRRHVPAPQSATANRDLGACADPERDGVVSAAPSLERTQRDLNGDGEPETLVADRKMCTREGNCHWNVYVNTRPGCTSYAGTIGAAALEPMQTIGDAGFRDVRAWWNLTGGGRLLMEEYQYRHGGYRVVDSLLCRREDGARIVCAPADR